MTVKNGIMEECVLKDIISNKISGEWGNGDGGTKVLRTANFTNEGVIDFSNVVKREISEKNIEKKRLLPGDIIIEKSGGSPTQPVGRVVFFNVQDEVYLCNNFTAILRTDDSVDSKYLFHFLFYIHQIGVTSKFQNKTTGIINLKLDRYLEKVKIPLPPLPEQKRIATKLDKADALRQKNKQLLASYDELLQATFLDMFGDPGSNPNNFKTIQFGDIIKEGPTNGIYKPKSEYGKGTYILRIDSFNNGDLLINEKIRRVSADEKEKKKYSLQTNDIVINRVNSRSHLGKVALIKAVSEETIFESNMMRIKVDSKDANPLFLIKILSHPFIKVQVLNRAKDAVNQSSINQQDVKGFNFYLPPIKLQDEFAQIVENIEAQKTIVKQSLQESVDLFNGLVQKAFKGELIQ